MTPAIAHPALLTRAVRLQAAASERDIRRVHREVTRLLDAYVAHVAHEQEGLDRLGRFDARLVRRGQERLLADLIELTVEADAPAGDDGCRCEALVQAVAARLEVQADTERRLFARAGVHDR